MGKVGNDTEELLGITHQGGEGRTIVRKVDPKKLKKRRRAPYQYEAKTVIA